MRVLFLTHSYPRYAGDASGSFIMRLAQALCMEGIEVHVVAPGANGLASTEEIEGIPVVRFRYAPRKYETLAYTGSMAEDVASYWSARLAMLSFLGAGFTAAVRERRAFLPDIVHAHWWFPNGLIGTWVSALAQIPLITTTHGTDIRMLRSAPMARPIARRVLSQSATVTTVSHWLAGEEQALTHGATPIVAPMPVATELFTPGGTRASDRILFVGRLNDQKGITYAIRALALMRNPATLDIVGTGPQQEDCQALAHTLGIANRVIFHGQVAQQDLVPMYRRAAAVVVPSVDEGLGLVSVEALLCETPVVAFASGGTLDVVQQNSTGLLVPPRDVTALSHALDEIMMNPTLATNMGKAGRLYALATFAPESAARRYAGIYRDVLKHRAA
jgi:glycosyltransferase involved in cell wall biosynthesis